MIGERAKSVYRGSPLWRTYDWAAQALDDHVGWHRLPKLPGLLALVGIRNILRRENLFHTGGAPSQDEPAVAPFQDRVRTERTADGSYNDLADPAMGMAGSRFGRNVDPARTWPEPDAKLLEPNPRTVSRELLTRDAFVPATTVNNLAAAWLQFMIRDWFSHGRSETSDPWQVQLLPGDDFPQQPMQIMRTRRDPTRPPRSEQDAPPTYVNTATHWWDGSSIYGVTPEQQRRARSGTNGKLVTSVDGRLPVGPDPARDPAREPGFWVGLLMLHTLFTREHNAICDRLRAEYPRWEDEQLFQRARLVNAALLAKIHTTEWTPAVISHPTTVTAMSWNWFGVAGERVHDLLGRISGSEVISGIPGTETAHYGVPFALTEEFVAVYRMHPLIADDWSLRAVADDRPLAQLEFRELTGPAAVTLADELGMTDLLYSFGTEHPGLVTLHNFPRFLQSFERPDGKLMDLAAVDVLRVRELGVPRYCEMRRLLHLKAPKTFEQLTQNARWARELREVYGDVERVDLVVGMYAEPLPKGFAFSDTAFRIFILMASRRLNSDRFFTRDYTPQVYTQAGLDWIDATRMSDVLLRHHPDLRPALHGVSNAFAPWQRAAGPATTP